jgi:phosphate transport system substrate-binding protein
MKIHIAAALTAAAFLAGCQGPRQEPSTVRGSAAIQVDESLEPVMRLEVEDFGNSYPDARIAMSVAHAREAVVNFLNDSVRVIVLARELNNEERAFVNARKGKKDEIDLAEWRVAMDAVAVIVHPGNPVTKFRFGELDSIFSGLTAFWSGGGRNPVRVGPVVPDVNSSVNEVFRTRVMGGRPFAPSVTPLASSDRVIDEVAGVRGAIGIVGLSSLRGRAHEVAVCSISDPSHRPDTLLVPGQYFSPAQAHVFRGYYPLARPVMIYRREYRTDVGYGLISYITSPPGQKIFLNNGLVPQTQPVRIVELTSQQVTTP